MTRGYLLKKIGAALPVKKLIVEDQDAYDIIRQILKKHQACTGEYDRIADEFAGLSPYDTAEKLWVFCKKNIRYDEETLDRQNVSSPQTILTNGHCDCKGYALFIGGVLDALNRQGENIKWKYRFASDDMMTTIPGHVFVVVMDRGKEIWIDPVMNEFNQDHWFPSYEDKKISRPAAMAGCGCAAMGATTSQTGAAIMKIAPALAVVPVVGWIAAAAGEIIGGIVSIVGSKWNQSPDVRWLVQLYEYFARGMAGVTSDNKVNEADVQPAQAFFSVVLGVPIGGRKDFNILQSGNGDTNTPTGRTPAQRASDYLAFKGLQGRIPIEQVIEAATIAGSLDMRPVPGSWAGLTPAPSVISTGNAAQPTLFVDSKGALTNADGQLVSSGVGSGLAGNKKILLAAAAAVALIFFTK